ncbi:alpha-amylase family glycosyl hydrolase [Sphingobium sp. AP49]|uniref:alpha-amylase family glycosyl hydrolase n=1 Tax=Sphingobium sp. AP49 TaxID=1144307 RepID=UPI00055A9BCD|nr:alpha-amylase family glycosyl hydrolase [Sphingobium sp. AP49]WHO38526.1 alpha-amylase family glycosyl hydrolase [Sphingobium sp. AP49]
MKRYFHAASIALLLLSSSSQAVSQPRLDLTEHAVDQPQPYAMVQHPRWSRDAVLYEINLRQFTHEGSLRAAQAELPRLQKMGVGIIWLMPIHPIGEKNRLGALGSPYSVRDYLAVNPEFGSLADLKAFVTTAHRLGMYVILDWVANHSSWDNTLTLTHPDWYEHDEQGEFRPPAWTSWTDVIAFDYARPGLRRYMTEALKYWVREADVDGFRADYAGGVPLQFWENARTELEQIKPVFMLAEWDYPELHRRAFDASYAWKLVQAMRDVAQGRANTAALAGYWNVEADAWPHEAYRLAYTSNHDSSAWEGSDRDIYGPALTAMTALTFAADTMPLIYNGQEAEYPKRLNFLTRDAIAWRDAPAAKLYSRLIAWKKANPATFNGQYGGAMVEVKTSAPGKIFAFVRQREKNKILALFNFTAQPQRVTLQSPIAHGRYDNFDGGQPIEVNDGTQLEFPPWSFKLFATGTSTP